MKRNKEEQQPINSAIGARVEYQTPKRRARGVGYLGRTRVISIAIYEHVETLRYAQAHLLSAALVIFALCVLLCVYIMNPTRMAEVRACSDQGAKMPQKSTDFYPKVITGLVAMTVGADERL